MPYYDPQTKTMNTERPTKTKGTAMIPKPLFCVFCGRDDAEVVGDCTKNPSYYFVICGHCEANGPTDYDKAKAVEKWNQRYSEPRDPDRSYDGMPDYWYASTPERKPY